MKTKLTIIYFSFYLIFDILVSNFYFNINYKNYGKLHNFYHHTFQENLDININFGPIYYRFCSNIYGFRVHCENKDAIKNAVILDGIKFTTSSKRAETFPNFLYLSVL